MKVYIVLHWHKIAPLWCTSGIFLLRLSLLYNTKKRQMFFLFYGVAFFSFEFDPPFRHVHFPGVRAAYVILIPSPSVLVWSFVQFENGKGEMFDALAFFHTWRRLPLYATRLGLIWTKVCCSCLSFILVAQNAIISSSNHNLNYALHFICTIVSILRI